MKKLTRKSQITYISLKRSRRIPVKKNLVRTSFLKRNQRDSIFVIQYNVIRTMRTIRKMIITIIMIMKMIVLFFDFLYLVLLYFGRMPTNACITYFSIKLVK